MVRVTIHKLLVLTVQELLVLRIALQEVVLAQPVFVIQVSVDHTAKSKMIVYQISLAVMVEHVGHLELIMTQVKCPH